MTMARSRVFAGPPSVKPFETEHRRSDLERNEFLDFTKCMLFRVATFCAIQSRLVAPPRIGADVHDTRLRS
jgi:hypothetical protein